MSDNVCSGCGLATDPHFYQPNYIEELARDSRFPLDLLPPAVQTVAIDSVIRRERQGLDQSVAAAISAARVNIHNVINDTGHIRRLHHQFRLLRRMSTNPTVAARFIVDNLLTFRADGTYAPY